ncbi:MAG: hypothetical protein JW797_05505 [Bradymonadales bacterium]|nr:hypothetical protein [Bradymonadales bacterium]
MSRISIYAIVTSCLILFLYGCTESDSGSGNPASEADVGDDIREHPNADAISWDLNDVPTQTDPAVSGEICDNQQDDDDDGDVDCDDDDCADFPACDETPTEEICNNQQDDDGDLRIDCDDSDCYSFPDCQVEPTDEDCTNNIDDDRDGLTDCYDGDCALDPACRASVAEDCFNGQDDDADGLTDCDDSDCTQACQGGTGTGSEEDMLFCIIMCMMDPDPETCLMNCMGGGFGGTGETDCDNNIDDNGDGMTDCEDMTCMMDPACM